MSKGLASAAAGAVVSNNTDRAPYSTELLGAVRTGNSSLDRFGKRNRNVRFNLDPSIREGQDTFLKNVRGLRDSVGSDFDAFQSELGTIRDEVKGLRESFVGNQSAFREATLNPLRERIARREGSLTRELDRTEVRGTFRDQALTNFDLAAGRELSDAEARIENERINNLGNLLGMDADLLKQSLASETARNTMLLNLEESLKSVSTERFNQELALLNLGQGQPGGANDSAANLAGIRAQTNVRLLGEIIDAFGSDEKKTA